MTTQPAKEPRGHRSHPARRLSTRPAPSGPVGFLIWLLGLGLLLSTPDATAQPAGRSDSALLQDLARAMGGVETVFTHFTQERHLSLFKEPLRTEGSLCFQKPGRLRWETTKPYQSIMVTDGSGVAQFERMNEGWKKLDLGLAGPMQQVINQIGGVLEGRYVNNPRDYDLTVTNAADGLIIQLAPRQAAMKKMIRSIEIHLAPDLRVTRRVVLREIDGDYTDIRFDEQKAGVRFPAATFDRTKPVPLAEIQTAVNASASPR